MDFSGLIKSSSPAVEPPLDAPIPLPVDTYKTTEKESMSADQAIKRVGAKMAEKFKEIGAEWIPISAVARDLFNNTEDRNSARDLVDRAIAVGRLESEDRENPNKTKTTFVRVNKLFSINKNSTSET